MENAIDILQKYWGYPAFRGKQEAIINAVLEQKNTLALLPTGGGKSICFQVPALSQEGICIVISPLIALIKDQVEQLTRRKIKAVAIYSGMNKREIDIVLDNCIYGNYKFLYVSPERLKTDIFIERFKKMNVNLLAIDEAHCISQWGHDFRPSYREIAAIREWKPEVPLIALTASANTQVCTDVVNSLGIPEATVFKQSFYRDNLSFSVRLAPNKINKCIEILHSIPGAAIVYVNTRKAARDVTKALQNAGIYSDYYHGGLKQDQRSAKQNSWINNQTRVMVATNAFGMGIDKPDVRLVIHYELPSCIEAYYQEAGRAGRDGKNAFAVLLYVAQDFKRLLQQTKDANPELATIKRVYQALANHYKLAVGSMGGQAYDFNLAQFSQTYSLHPVETYNALLRLRDHGLILYNEGMHIPSRVMIKVSNTNLYEFQIANATFDSFIKILLRVYGGELFGNFVRIQEEQLARIGQESVPETMHRLKKLAELNILEYEPRSDLPQIVFVNERMDISNLGIDQASLTKRAERAQEKSEKIIGYVESAVLCRSRYIQMYFDEKAEHNCGKCDVCIARKKGALGDAELKKEILALFKTNNTLEVESIVEAIGHYDSDFVIKVIRALLNEGKLNQTEEGKLTKIG